MIEWVLEARGFCCAFPHRCAERDGYTKCPCLPSSRLSSLPGKAFLRTMFLLASWFGFLWISLVHVLNVHQDIWKDICVTR